MLLPTDQRHVLGAFLRARREALSPAAVGLRVTVRRRTPGLRREEVAHLSGLSTTWYSWVEQGRDIALSEFALARLASALRLTSAERAYLFELTRRRDPATGSAATVGRRDDLDALVAAIETPAYVMDPLWSAQSWNTAAGRLFAPWFDSGEPNLLRFVFLDPAAQRFIKDWDSRARRVIAEFRADTAHDPDSPEVAGLVRDLRDGSATFAALWTSHAVLSREGGVRTFDHPVDGHLVFRQITLVPASHPGYKVVVLLPATGGNAG